MFTHLTVLNKEVSSAKNLTSEFSPCGRSFIEMRKSIGPNTDPCGTPALIDSQPEDWPFKMTFDVYYGRITQSIERHSCLSYCF